jgi:hypothetical protein
MKARVEENRDRHSGVAERADSESEKLNPFPGPQPYARGQSDLFFGRSDSVAQLTSLLLSSHIVLLHAPSGSGKSSLLNAGLYPRLEQLDIPVVASVRFARERRAESIPAPADTVTDASDDDNPFTKKVVQALLGTEHARSDVKTISDAVRVVEAERDENIFVTVLDQFEEIFIDPLLWHAREELLTQLADAVRLTDRVRVIIGMRSDYLASLIPYERQLSSQLMVRIGLQSLKEPAARRVIQKAFERTGVAIEESELDHVLDALFTSSPETGAIGVRSEFANLIQLQIVCRRLWEQLWQRQFAVGGPYHGTIPVDARASMAAFVDEAVTSVSERARIDEGWVRNWLETLVLPGGRRALISLESPSAPQGWIIDELERARLIRVELRNESRVAELTHDSMVDALLESNESWRRRQRKSRLLRLGTSVVILASLVAVFALALIVPATIVTGDFDFSASKSHNLEFDAVPDRPYALAELSVDGPAGETADLIVTVTDVQTPTGTGLDIFNAQLKVNLDTWGTGSTIFAFKTATGTRYRLTVATDLSSLQVNVKVRGREDAQSYAGNEIEVDAYDAIVELPPGVYSIRSDGYGRINAANVLLKDSHETVVVIDRRPLLAFSSSTSDKVKISRLDVRHHTYDGQMSFHVEGDAIAEIDVGWDHLPALAIAHCKNVANFLGYGVDGTPLPKVQSSQSAELQKSDQYLLTTAGTYRMRLKPVPGKKATCEVQVQQQGKMVNNFGRVGVPMKVGSAVGAIALRMPAEGLIIAPSIGPITYSLSCRGGGGVDMSIAGGKFTGWLPAGRICILAIANSDPSKFETVHIDAIKLPGINVTGPRR